MEKCSICGRTEAELSKNRSWVKLINHHTDYLKDITILLCPSCHRKWHRDNKPIGTRKEWLKIQSAKKPRNIRKADYENRKRINGWYLRLNDMMKKN